MAAKESAPAATARRSRNNSTLNSRRRRGPGYNGFAVGGGVMGCQMLAGLGVASLEQRRGMKEASVTATRWWRDESLGF